MKSTLFYLLLSLQLVAWSCSKPAETTDPKAKLAALKSQVKELNDQILELQLQIAQTDTTAPSGKAKLVETDSVFKRDFRHYIEVQGTVDANQNVLASPEMPGVVRSIYVKEGDVVSQGKILAALDGSTIRKGMDEVRTGLSLAQTMYEKQKKLWEQNIGSEAQYLQAKNQKEQLEQKMKTLESQLAMTYIKAPVSGVVDEVKLKLGEMANPGFSGIRVVNDKSMKIKAKLSDSYLGKVKKGDKVLIVIPGQEKNLESAITFISKTINPQTRTMIIEASLPSGSRNFVTNQAVSMKINNGFIKDAIVVSSNLVQRSIQGEDYVLVAEASGNLVYARKRTVETGMEYNGETQIVKGLQPGDRLITTGFSELVDGQLIAL